MAFTVPTFNITVGIWEGPWSGKVHRLDSPANYAFGRRVQQQYQDFAVPDTSVSSFQSLLLCPAHTDIRSGIASTGLDYVEIPLGSGRWYGVLAVDAVAMGFPNEYTAAVVTQVSASLDPAVYAGLIWPLPMT